MDRPASARQPERADAFVGLLKADLFGRVERWDSSDEHGCAVAEVRRQCAAAARGCGWLARRLAAREARALQRLAGLAGVPRLYAWDGACLRRSWQEGQALQRARPAEAEYFAGALALLARVHRRGVTHNDLAKEPNWLVTPERRAALVDFQLASVWRRRGRRFRLAAREDLRHLLKHKRSYCPQALTPRERALLARPSWAARLWRWTYKPVYRLVTRGLLGWADREGAGDRGGVSP